MTVPTTLTEEQAEAITELLIQARIQLRDAAGARHYEPNYGTTSRRIADVLEELGVDRP
ncbi:hypothetical protein [Diaphorobacter sp. LR2014-1]|uniref:hypothetical protein n=1 Tax=Diaphorobacter sp. LR2014-1 TaxID=1933219 RepID=UPI00155F1C84|nr:hypothetical protein [Diaphorobacter sp. LR2014-1]